MVNNTSNNKRIAKNTMALYARMFISLVVGLYTSRVVLNVLGVEDFGVYGVVGGVVGLMGFLNATMSGATSRFITFELGTGDKKKLKDTFSSALIIHILIALFVLIIAETVGLWFLNNKLVIPEERMAAANWVYQLSIISALFTITQVPYNATIISRENMNIYAYVEIINVTLKLIIVYLIQVIGGDKLIMYGLLYLIVSFLILMTYRVYCTSHYEESRFHFVWRKDILKPLLSFSGWDLYGNFAGVARQQGSNMVINMFFGPVLNAASSIATTVSGVVMQFASNVVVAIKPQIIKSYAQKSYEETARLIDTGCVINFLLLSIISIPLIVEMNYVLHLWLGIVPDSAVLFCQLQLVFNIFANQSLVIITGVHATGRIKIPSIILGTLYFLVVPITYIAFRLGGQIAWLPYLVNVLAVMIGMSSNAYILSRYMSQYSFANFLLRLFVRFTLPFLATIYCTSMLSWIFEETFGRLVLTIVISTAILITFAYLWIIPKGMRDSIITHIKLKLCKKA